MSLEVTTKPRSFIQEFSGKIDWKVGILFLLPLILIVINASWILLWPLRGVLDAWIYTGYFLDLEAHLKYLPNTYFATRLPWILPGFLAHKFFSPLTANYILHLIFYYAAIFSLYSILKKAISARAAFLATILMGSFTFFLEALGSDYIDGAGLTYLLLTLLTLTNVHQSKCPRFRLFLAGVFCCCTFFTQLFLITYAPLIALYYFFTNYPLHHHSFKTTFKFFFFGFFTLTLFLCCTNEFFGGKFFFFAPAIKTAGRLTLNNDFWLPLSKWWRHATWLFFPLILSFGSLLTFIFYKKVLKLPNGKNVLFFQAFFLLSFFLFVVFQFIEKQTVLQCPYYVSYLLPSLFLALGGQFMIATQTLKFRSYSLLAALTLVISILGFALSSDSFAFIKWFHVYLILAFLGCLSLFFLRRSWKIFGIFFLTLAFATFNLQHNFSKQSIPDLATQKSAFLALHQCFEIVNQIDPKRRGIFWFNQDESHNSLYWAICCNYLCHHRLINEHFPQMSHKNIYIIPKEKRKIFVLSTGKNTVEEANKGLLPMGFFGTIDQEVELQQGPIQFKITALKVKNLQNTP